MELKYKKGPNRFEGWWCSNRTFMELKLGGGRTGIRV